jgi:metal-responsive CopG/Arc/MetJ family transcriptional regulator
MSQTTDIPTTALGTLDRRFRPTPRQHIQVRVPEPLRRDIDAFADERGLTRTAVVESAIRLFLAVNRQDGAQSHD